MAVLRILEAAAVLFEQIAKLEGQPLISNQPQVDVSFAGRYHSLRVERRLFLAWQAREHDNRSDPIEAEDFGDELLRIVAGNELSNVCMTFHGFLLYFFSFALFMQEKVSN